MNIDEKKVPVDDIECQRLVKNLDIMHQSFNIHRDTRDPAIWQSCCFHIHRGIVFFIAQISISLLVLFFCVYQVSRPQEVASLELSQYYFGLLSIICGV